MAMLTMAILTMAPGSFLALLTMANSLWLCLLWLYLLWRQVQFSLLSTLPLESGLFEACAELGVTPIGYSPLALGLLSDRYDENNLPKVCTP
jgi:predicted oxidoreductase